MNEQVFATILITRGRQIVTMAQVSRDEALTLEAILQQRGADLRETVNKLEKVLLHVRATGRYKPTLRVEVSLKDRKSGLYVSAQNGISIKSANLIVKAARLGNEAGLQSLVRDLQRIIMGTVKPGQHLLPFLNTEGILPKA